jgi:hypothetical protein
LLNAVTNHKDTHRNKPETIFWDCSLSWVSC